MGILKNVEQDFNARFNDYLESHMEMEEATKPRGEGHLKKGQTGVVVCVTMLKAIAVPIWHGAKAVEHAIYGVLYLLGTLLMLRPIEIGMNVVFSTDHTNFKNMHNNCLSHCLAALKECGQTLTSIVSSVKEGHNLYKDPTSYFDERRGLIKAEVKPQFEAEAEFEVQDDKVPIYLDSCITDNDGDGL